MDLTNSSLFSMVLSKIIDSDKNLLGYTILYRINDSDIIRRISLSTIRKLYSGGFHPKYPLGLKFENADFDSATNNLVGTQGDLNTYPVVTDKSALVGRNGLIATEIVTDGNGIPLGAVCYNGFGKKYRLSFSKIESLSHSVSLCNFRVSMQGSYKTIEALGNPYKFNTSELIKKEKSQIYDTTAELDKAISCGLTVHGTRSRIETPSITGTYHFDDSIQNSEFTKGAAAIWADAMFNLSAISPYYYYMMQSIKVYEAVGLGTLGITEDTLYYDVEFVSRLSVAELTFILIHEMSHIAMQHSIRQGVRDHELWNIATDLYINSSICSDFGQRIIGSGSLEPGLGEVTVKSISGNTEGVIAAPDFGIFVETVNEVIDFSKDTPESIYDRLLEENPNFGQPQGQSGQQGGQGGQQGGQGGQQGGQSGQQGGQGGQQGSQGGQQGGQSGQQGSQGGQQGGQQGSQGGQQGGCQSIASAIQQIVNGAKQARDNISNASGSGSSNAAMANRAVNNINSGTTDVNWGNALHQSGQRGNDANQMQQGANQINNGLQQIKDNIDALNNLQNSSGCGNTPQGQQAIQNMVNGLNNLQNALNNQGQDGQGQGQQGQEQGQGNGQGQGQGNGQGQGQGNGQGQGQGDGQGDQNDAFSNDADSTPQEGENDLDTNDPFDNGVKEVEITFNGKKIKGKVIKDIMTNHKGADQNNIDKRLEETQHTLQKIQTKMEMEAQNGNVSSADWGTGSGYLNKRNIEFGLEQGIDWRVLLRNVCKQQKKKLWVRNKPNRKALASGRILPSQVKGKNEKILSDIKICVDVSGSVSSEDLNRYIGEIADIFNHYEVDGELIFWDTEITDAGSFSELKDIITITGDVHGGGGTDVRPVFEYISGQTEFRGKKQKVRVPDISCVLFITDGCFSENYGDYAPYFDKKTIWIIDGNAVLFNKQFGKVISLTDDKNRHSN